jgi:hypothetical protein
MLDEKVGDFMIVGYIWFLLGDFTEFFLVENSKKQIVKFCQFYDKIIGKFLRNFLKVEIQLILLIF